MAALGKASIATIDRANTTRTRARYRSNWQHFVNFCRHLKESKQQFLPASPCLIRCFCEALCKEGKAPSTIRTYLEAIADVHQSTGFTDPTSNYLVTKHMRGVAKHRPSINTRSPLSTHDLKKLVKALSATGCTFFTLALLKTMFALMFFAFLRISEVTKGEHNINMSQCHVTKSKIKLTFLSYKHSTGRPFKLDIQPTGGSTCPHLLLKEYVKLRGHDGGPLLRFSDKLPLSRSYFSSRLRKAATAAKLDAKQISPHSFRIGATTWAAKRGSAPSKLRQWVNGAPPHLIVTSELNHFLHQSRSHN